MSTIDTLLSPVILFFILGALAAAARSDLSVPEPIAKGMSLYLMAAIGLKGGVQVSAAGLSSEMAGAAIAGMGLSVGLPFIAFALLRSWGGLDRLNSGA
ncbi:MAG: sodium-dependent bicarbonate transport family permease, partial [Sphingomonadaceae bacterium]|nr:sodium-dependent bicarbonate transport family permease [Sphingomonadaceae bacterium]